MIERACLKYGKKPKDKNLNMPAKNQLVAIVGGGLSALTAALELRKKGYYVDLYETRDRLGGSLWDFPTDTLPREIIESEIQSVTASGISIFLGHPVHDLNALAESHQYAAFYLGLGQQNQETLGLNINGCRVPAVDPLTLATERSGVFAGGSIRLTPGQRSPINSVADGKRAALSIDRYIKKVSLTAGRESEGAHSSGLYTKTSGIPRLWPVLSGNQVPSREEAVLEAERCLQCQCMECVRNCVFLENYRGYPKKYANEIAKNIIVVPGMGMRSATKMLNSCSLCGLCAKVCPTGVDMASVCLSAREEMVKKGYMPEAIHDFPLRDMASANSNRFALVRHQAGTSSSKYLFYPGCQLSGARPQYVQDTYRYLTDRLEGGVGIMLGCCGAPANWAGRTAVFAETWEQWLGIWENMGQPTVILACTTCNKMLKEHADYVPRQMLWQVFLELGLPYSNQITDGKVLAVHDPCTSRDEPQIQATVRQLLLRMGYQLEELPLNHEYTECCGYGGLMRFSHPALADRVVQRRIGESERDYVAYCAPCRDNFAEQGKTTWHLLDLIYNNRTIALGQKGPGFSQRQENRWKLKRHLLNELWGEEMEENPDYTVIKLRISPEVQDLLDRRFILHEDIQQVIYEAEKTAMKLIYPDSGHYVSHRRSAIITYWVEYSPEGDGFIVHNAYNHRLQIIEDVDFQ
jgi:Fe-S oxidoreductase